MSSKFNVGDCVHMIPYPMQHMYVAYIGTDSITVVYFQDRKTLQTAVVSPLFLAHSEQKKSGSHSSTVGIADQDDD